MKNAYTKDILRTIQKNAKRFLAIMAIMALGLTTFSGITAAVRDMYIAADAFYDEQKMFDVRVLSTLGLTDEDVRALQAVAGVEVASAAYSETVHTEAAGLRQSAEVRMLSREGVNTPWVLQGALPQAKGEIAATQKYLDESGKALGDTLSIEEELDGEDGMGEGDAEDGGVSVASSPGAGDLAEEETEEEDGFGADIDWDADIDIAEEAESPTFRSTEYTIVGVVVDPLDIGNNEGTTAFRATSTTDYTFFVSPADVDTEVYTSIYLVLHGLAALDTYADEYGDEVQAVITRIENEIMNQRQQARYGAVMAEALEKLADAEAEMDEKFGEADEAFADAWVEIEDAKREILDGEATLTEEERDALQKLASARTQLEDGKRQLAEGEAELADALLLLQAGEAEYKDGLADYEAGLAEYQANRASMEALAGGVAGLGALYESLGDLLADYATTPVSEQAALLQQFLQTAGAMPPVLQGVSALFAQAGQDALAGAISAIAQDVADKTAADTTGTDIAACQAVYAAASAFFLPQESSLWLVSSGAVAAALDELDAAEDELNAAWALLLQGKAELDAGRAQYEEGAAQLRAARTQLAEGEATLNAEEADALQKLADAWRELADGKQELAEGEAELLDNERQYQEKRAEAEEKLADAYAELADIDMAQWYVQDRGSIDSYSSMNSDLQSIDAIGRAFPILFLVVAILISLTTMTRMVEEERGLIGTYKALGFGNFAIGWKYVLYALLAALAGGVLGNVLGFAVLPQLIVYILRAIYILPAVPMHFNAASALLGTGLFTVSIVAATALACAGEVRQTPAALMRPKAPRAGARIFLERIPFVWNRLKFLNKVTARNLFRYKKRLFMTVIGIAGCTALVLAGFAIRDSVTDLMPRQYEHIYRYDLMAVANDDDADELQAYFVENDAVADSLLVRVESVKVFNASGASESLQMVVVPDGQALSPYIHTPGKDGKPIELDGTGALITQNAAEILGLSAGDDATVQTLVLDRQSITVAGVVEHYLGNSVYITQSLYQRLFGPYEANAAYAHFTDAVEDAPAFADALLDEDFIVSAHSTAALKSQFSTDFAILNYVIYILLALAAGLAFVVLFTLANTNISERVRELATIKVLGFFDREVHAYVNKETLILTGIGILAGLPLGYALTGLLLATLKMPALQFALTIQPQSYLYAAVISFAFALVVNLITNRILDKINMVEALKSVE